MVGNRIEKRSVKIPTIVWDINMQCKKDAKLHIVFEFILEKDALCGADMSDYEAMENAVECEYFALSIGDKCYKPEKFSVEFDIALESICKRFKPRIGGLGGYRGQIYT